MQQQNVSVTINELVQALFGKNYTTDSFSLASWQINCTINQLGYNITRSFSSATRVPKTIKIN